MPQLTIHCTFPNSSLAPTCVTFRISPCYGFVNAAEAHDWFLAMMQEHEEFEVETDEPGERGWGFGVILCVRCLRSRSPPSSRFLDS